MSKKLSIKQLQKSYSLINNKQPRPTKYASQITEQRNQFFLPNDTYNNRKVSVPILDPKKYNLPLLWVTNYQKVPYESDMKDENQVQYQVRCEGTLAFENGSPVSLNEFKFFLPQFEKKLDKFYKICRKSYHIIFRTLLKNVKSHSDLEQHIMVGQNINGRYEDEINRQIAVLLQQNKQNLFKFLIQIGLISCKQKNVNRFRSIYLSKIIKQKAREILSIHQQLQIPEQKIFIQQSVNKSKKGKSKNSNNRSSFVSQQAQQKCLSQPSTSITYRQYGNDIRECCQRQLKSQKHDYPQVRADNSSVISIENNKIKQLKIGQELGSGGYFQVRKCQVVLRNDRKQKSQVELQSIDDENPIQKASKEQNQQNLHLNLAIKMLKQQIKDQILNKKIERQINIIKQIPINPYVCKYFQFEPKTKQNLDSLDSFKDGIKNSIKQIFKNSMIMEHLTISLKQIMTHKVYSNYFLISKQLTKSILALHRSGIVHRDIKPGNIMFDDQGHLKLIDFSQGMQCWRSYSATNPSQNQRVGFTLPYSPLQCSKLGQQGYANMKIDNWSLGMTISELILGNLPICYSKSLKSTIISGWPTQQFHMCMNLRKSNFFAQILFPVKIMCIKLMHTESKKRICVQSLLNILEFYHETLFLKQQKLL